MTTDDGTKPIGYATLREALAVIIEHEAERARPNSDREKLSLPKSKVAASDDTDGAPRALWPEVIDADEADWPP